MNHTANYIFNSADLFSKVFKKRWILSDDTDYAFDSSMSGNMKKLTQFSLLNYCERSSELISVQRDGDKDDDATLRVFCNSEFRLEVWILESDPSICTMIFGPSTELSDFFFVAQCTGKQATISSFTRESSDSISFPSSNLHKPFADLSLNDIVKFFKEYATQYMMGPEDSYSD